MASLIEPGTATIRTLKLRAASGERDALTLRTRLQRQLGAVSLHPTGLPAQAILCVRRMRDPMPGALRLDRGTALPASAWQNAVKASLDQLAHSAARPADGPVPPASEAVLFADRAELLACLAADWLSGALVTRWWWAGLFGGELTSKGAAAVTRDAWLDAPEYIPSALQQLAGQGRAARFASALEDRTALEMLRRVLRVYGLADLSAVLDHAFVSAATTTTHVVLQQPSESQAPLPPWQHAAPEWSVSGLRPPQASLLGIGLALRQSPAAVSAPSFTEHMSLWLRAVAVTPSNPSGGAQEGTKLPTASPSTAPGALVTGASETATRPTTGHQPIDVSERGAMHLAPGLMPTLPAQPGASATPSLPEGIVVQPGASSAAANSLSSQLPQHNTNTLSLHRAVVPFESPTHAITPDRQDAVVIEPVPNVSIQTGLGGLFYLVNLGIYLGLYGDFASPLRPGIALSIYDFVALVGQRLVSSIAEDKLDADRDPVWEFLTRLAGRREDEAPCADDLGVPLDEWLDGLMPQIRDRLNRALGLTGEDPSELPRLLLVHPARVTASGTHLDVFLSLNDLPISIRLSGLDRNPGWVPAAGRFIAFHFE